MYIPRVALRKRARSRSERTLFPGYRVWGGEIHQGLLNCFVVLVVCVLIFVVCPESV